MIPLPVRGCLLLGHSSAPPLWRLWCESDASVLMVASGAAQLATREGIARLLGGEPYHSAPPTPPAAAAGTEGVGDPSTSRKGIEGGAAAAGTEEVGGPSVSRKDTEGRAGLSRKDTEGGGGPSRKNTGGGGGLSRKGDFAPYFTARSDGEAYAAVKLMQGLVAREAAMRFSIPVPPPTHTYLYIYR